MKRRKEDNKYCNGSAMQNIRSKRLVMKEGAFIIGCL